MYRLMKYPRIAIIVMFLSLLGLAVAGDAQAEDTTEVASAVVKITLVVMLVRWLWRMLH